MKKPHYKNINKQQKFYKIVLRAACCSLSLQITSSVVGAFHVFDAANIIM